MSRTLPIVIIFVNLVGLLVVQIIESLRPGIISAVISLGWIWLGAVVLVSVTGLIARSRPD